MTVEIDLPSIPRQHRFKGQSFIRTDKVRVRRGGRSTEDVGVMKDEGIKIEEIESSHTLGGM
jgi:hypothetical protein